MVELVKVERECLLLLGRKNMYPTLLGSVAGFIIKLTQNKLTGENHTKV